MTDTLTINASQVVHETIDGEAILIHLGTGTYYSLDGAGGEVWDLLKAGVTREAIVAELQERYESDPGTVRETVLALIEQLGEEDLIVAGSAEATASPRAATEQAADSFEAPVLRKYTDMQEFILLDPIHDVDEDAGWPNVKPG